MDVNYNPNLTIKLRFHIIFWICYFVFNVLRWGSYFNDFWYSLKSNLVEFPLHILLVYINLYFFIPKFLLQKKYKLYFFLLIISLAFIYITRTTLNYFFVTDNLWPESTGVKKMFNLNHVVAVSLGELYVLALVTLIKFTIDWVNQKKRIEDLQKEQLKTELKFLRTQIQPHFFFNTLNNLYALTLEKSEKAPDVVIKLSNIMQYVLYEIKGGDVKLLKEINYIKDYIHLEKLRYGDKIKFKINTDGEIENVLVPPLLFLSFVENSFKHGFNNGKLILKIYIKNIKNKILLFSIENNFQHFDKNNKHGIGNKNIKRRLDLLYKNKYKLDISNENNIYKVVLKTPLKIKLI